MLFSHLCLFGGTAKGKSSPVPGTKSFWQMSLPGGNIHPPWYTDTPNDTYLPLENIPNDVEHHNMHQVPQDSQHCRDSESGTNYSFDRFTTKITGNVDEKNTFTFCKKKVFFFIFLDQISHFHIFCRKAWRSISKHKRLIRLRSYRDDELVQKFQKNSWNGAFDDNYMGRYNNM